MLIRLVSLRSKKWGIKIQIDTEISSTLYILRIFGDKITMKKLNNKNNNIYESNLL